MDLNGTIRLDIVRFCIIECKLQMSGELSCWNMIEAYEFARATGGPISQEFILKLGYIIEPGENWPERYRNVNVRVGSSIKPNFEHVPTLMRALIEAQDVLSPEEWFKEYEEIHPFRDGNGRSGVILYNYLKRNKEGHDMNAPIWAPNYWNDHRRTVGYGA